jgi:hypothetical protein
MSLVHFDTFKTTIEKGYFILTHGHTDHSYIAKSFQHDVYCSPFTYLLHKHRYKQLVPTLVYGDVYLDKKTKLHVFHTHHTPDSIGIFVYHTGVLYWGEGRFSTLSRILASIRPYMVQTVIHDAPHDVDLTLEQSLKILYTKIISMRVHTIILRNYAHLLLIHRLRHLFKFELSTIPNETGVAYDLLIRCFNILDWTTDSVTTIRLEKGINGTCVPSDRGYILVSGHRPASCATKYIVRYSSHASAVEIDNMLLAVIEHNRIYA